jgi:hypothetical protein
MLERFGHWFNTYNTEIVWWLIGWLSFSGLQALVLGNYISMLVDFGLAYFNYAMWKSRR